MMPDDELPSAPAVTAETRTPLEDDPALRDPAAALVAAPDAARGAAGALDVSTRAIRREHLRQLLRSTAFIIGITILLWWVICALFGKTFAPYDPITGNLTQFNNPPSAAHWFGTDSLGRDVLSRVIVGARDILVISLLATLLGTVVGTSIGLVLGYFRGVVDNVAGRIVEAVLALPIVVTAFIFAVAVGPSTLTLVLVIGFVFALIIARTVRTAVLQERELDYVAAARLRDESNFHIMFAEILPNVLGPIIVEFTVRLGYAIFTIATLSFLGFGVQAPTPDWGADIAASYQYLAAGYWWEVLFPAMAIASLIIAVNLIGDSIEAVLIQ
jgi:peptide/nickel transport system permease protein